MKCLEKDRNRRYETASSLARDIERYLNDEAVQACPPSASYRLKKLVRRNKVAAAFFVLLSAGLATLAVSNVMIQSALMEKNAALALALNNEQRATMEATKSKAVSDLLHQLIQRAVKEYGQVAVDSPGDFDRRLNATVGFVGLIKVCVEAPGFADAVDEANRRLTAELPQLLAAFPDSSDFQWQIALTYREWGGSLYNNRDYLPSAEHALSEAKEILEKLALSDPKRPSLWLQLGDTYSALGEIQWRSAKLQDAGAAFRRAIEIYDQHEAEIAKDPTYNVPGFIAVSCIRLAFFLAGTQRVDEAAEFVRRAARATERLQEPFELVNFHYLISIAQLRLGDEAGYRATCKALVDVPIAGVDDLTKMRQIHAWCLAPDALEDLSLPVKRAEELAAKNSVDQPHIAPYALGAALYRHGQYDRAAVKLEESITVYPSDPSPGFESINAQRLLLAMSMWQQGKKNEARRLLVETQRNIDQEIQSSSVFYALRAAIEVLRREAEALIEPNEADEAVENVSLNPEP
jgi:tetratricopeptide (TPR) repeat protein